MKLQADRMDAGFIQSFGKGWIKVEGEQIQTSVILQAGQPPRPWPCPAWTDLAAAHFDELLRHPPELVLFGTGDKQRFAHPSVYAGLLQNRIGIEFMDTVAACRTYNILLQEGRRVCAVLMFEVE
jgi:uncharacterized protein